MMRMLRTFDGTYLVRDIVADRLYRFTHLADAHAFGDLWGWVYGPEQYRKRSNWR